MSKRNRAIAAAKGLRSTPELLQGRAARARERYRPAPASAIREAGGRNAPSRKCPEPQAGSISRTSSRPNSSIAGVECAVEDEVLDELGRLQQRVLLRRFGEVLVEVAEKARVQRRVGEVVGELRRCRDRFAARTRQARSRRRPTGRTSTAGCGARRTAARRGQSVHPSKTWWRYSRSLSVGCC